MPDSLNICLVCTPATLAKLADSRYTEWAVDEMMTSEPGRVCRITDARLALEDVRKNMAASLPNIFANRYSKRRVSGSSSNTSFSQFALLMAYSICWGALVTTSLRKSIIKDII